ncbi:hypothetical protein D4764_17G0002700 [Takifugu flavidus]|uniref:Uncharacterized protein n=1 Tax=Takifugu flavidus TaxID=433684 RepID=A0A5C6NYH2_9TELE|nr:hypothetical protein D4764_17G0002700 [Takifugu flavidus]
MCARNHNSPHMRMDVGQTLFQVLVDLLGMTLYSGLGRGGSMVLVFQSIGSGGKRRQRNGESWWGWWGWRESLEEPGAGDSLGKVSP